MKKTLISLLAILSFGLSVAATPTAHKAFPGLLPASISEDGLKLSFTYDETGRLLSIGNYFTFDYTSGNVDGFSYDASMTANIVFDDDNEQIKSYYKTNEAGNITQCYSIEIEEGEMPDISTWTIEYDEYEHITYLSRGGDAECEVMVTYENGNAVSLKYTNDFFGQMAPERIIIPEYKDTIPNISGMMDFDYGLGLPLDVLALAYYAGMLGKPTALMPTGFTDNFGSSCSVKWTLNEDGYPTSYLQYEDGELDGRMGITWLEEAGIKSPTSCIDDGICSYYDLLGNAVALPQSGNIYIRIKNGSASKFVCR